jgi:hypothetical protein
VDPEIDVLPVFGSSSFLSIKRMKRYAGGLKLFFSEPVDENHETHYVRILANHDS